MTVPLYSHKYKVKGSSLRHESLEVVKLEECGKVISDANTYLEFEKIRWES